MQTNEKLLIIRINLKYSRSIIHLKNKSFVHGQSSLVIKKNIRIYKIIIVFLREKFIFNVNKNFDFYFISVRSDGLFDH